MMEQYDGVRVYYDGNKLRTSNSKTPLVIPTNITFPSMPFEGELW
jgi:hypothetical protein